MADLKETLRPPCGDSITWFGHACFRITDADGHSVVIDPYIEQVMGQSLEGMTADVVIVTHEHADHNNVAAVHARHLIHATEAVSDGEVKRIGDTPTGLIFTLISTYHDEAHGAQRGENTAVVWLEGGVTFCHLGDLGHQLTPRLVELIGCPDVLMLPVGGHFTINGKEARHVVAQLKPHVVIPMHYKIPDMTRTNLPIETEASFLDGDGQEPWSTVHHLHTPVLLVDADHLPGKTEVDVLDAVRLH